VEEKDAIPEDLKPIFKRMGDDLSLQKLEELIEKLSLEAAQTPQYIIVPHVKPK